MKKYSKYFLAAVYIVGIAFSTAACKEANAVSAAVTVGQPVDLTYAADKALPAVVHIKFVQNSKVQTVDVQSDPFSDFFSDPFGFFGRHTKKANTNTAPHGNRIWCHHLKRRIHCYQ